ncbi:hypothetical protein KAU19_06490 [Candidatus Parcubacteria bacterium]|nr:hypothetical protein [Candidatus Parcubacteria bacterium]
MSKNSYFLRADRPCDEFSIMVLELFFFSYVNYGRKDLNFSPKYIYVQKNGRVKLLVKEIEQVKFVKKSYEVILRNPNLFERRLNQWLEKYNKIDLLLKKIKKNEIEKISELKKHFDKLINISSDIPEVLLAGYHFIADLEQLTQGRIRPNMKLINEKVNQKLILKSRKVAEDYWLKIDKSIKILTVQTSKLFNLPNLEKNYLFMSLSDLKNVIENRKLNANFNKRKRSYALISGKSKIFEGVKEVNNFINRYGLDIYLKGDILKDIKELKGCSASKGFAKGKIVLATSFKEFAKKINNKSNFILVTIMTSPEFVSLLKNVSAIITDEGGLLCHAAIISREMNIPCIIGTKIATKVLKDGDLVEVDADKGVVKILKKK